MHRNAKLFKLKDDFLLGRSFSEYYGTVPFHDKKENEAISGSGNYYIHDVIFAFHRQNRAIYLNSSSKVLIELCSFYNNSSTDYGGSFCIKESDCILVHICCLLSSSDKWGCAYEIELYDESTNKSYAFECSVSQCKGDIKVSNMNTSNHYEITECAAYRIHSSKEAEIINFTTISNTSSKKQGVLANYGNLNIKKCNYLNNEDTNNGDAIIWCDTSCTYSNCSFIGNKGNYLFAVKPTFDNCYFNNNDVNQTLKFDFFPETFETGYPLDSFISHYTTDKCSATYFYKKKVSEKRLKMKDIKNIAINVYKTSFGHALNISTFKIV